MFNRAESQSVYRTCSGESESGQDHLHASEVCRLFQGSLSLTLYIYIYIYVTHFFSVIYTATDIPL